MLALATTLPELVTTLSAVRLGSFDFAVGNVFGSNAFNVVILLPLDLASPGLLLGGVSHVHALTCLAIIIVTAVSLLGLLYNAERRFGSVEGDALLVILLIVGALGMLYFVR